MTVKNLGGIEPGSTLLGNFVFGTQLFIIPLLECFIFNFINLS